MGANLCRLTPGRDAGTYGGYFPSDPQPEEVLFHARSSVMLLGGLLGSPAAAARPSRPTQTRRPVRHGQDGQSQALISYYRKKANVPPTQK